MKQNKTQTKNQKIVYIYLILLNQKKKFINKIFHQSRGVLAPTKNKMKSINGFIQIINQYIQMNIIKRILENH